MCEITDNQHFKKRPNGATVVLSAEVTHLRHAIVKYKLFKVEKRKISDDNNSYVNRMKHEMLIRRNDCIYKMRNMMGQQNKHFEALVKDDTFMAVSNWISKQSH